MCRCKQSLKDKCQKFLSPLFSFIAFMEMKDAGEMKPRHGEC